MFSGCSDKTAGDPLLEKTGQFVAAYNSEDAGRMARMVTADVRWLSVDRDSLALEVEGRDALQAAMEAFFAAGPRPPSKMRLMQRDGAYVVGVEEIMRGPTADGRNQCSVVIYEYAEELIRSVWYYQPAYSC